MSESIAAARSIAKPAAAPEPVWMPASFLEAQQVQPWSDMPVWVPSAGDSAGFAATDIKRAVIAGLRIRPLAETVADTLRWHLARPAAERDKLKAGLAPERETKLLADFRP
ncbi:MAG: hypothetical protein ACKO7G_07415 [Gammaproteobacteria bacterium]